MEKIKKEIGKINRKNILMVFLIGLAGYIMGTLTTMYVTLRYLEHILK